EDRPGRRAGGHDQRAAQPVLVRSDQIFAAGALSIEGPQAIWFDRHVQVGHELSFGRIASEFRAKERMTVGRFRQDLVAAVSVAIDRRDETDIANALVAPLLDAAGVKKAEAFETIVANRHEIALAGHADGGNRIDSVTRFGRLPGPASRTHRIDRGDRLTPNAADDQGGSRRARQICAHHQIAALPSIALPWMIVELLNHVSNSIQDKDRWVRSTDALC